MLSSTTPWAAPSRKEEGGVCEDRHTHPQHAQDMDAGSRTSGEQVSPENFRFSSCRVLGRPRPILSKPDDPRHAGRAYFPDDPCHVWAGRG